MVSIMKSNINELDAMLKDLSKTAHYSGSSRRPVTSSKVTNNDYYYSDPESSYSMDTGAMPPSRPPPPKDYSPVRSLQSRDYDDFESSASVTTTLPRRPPKPPKLQHILKDNMAHDLVKALPREDDIMEAPDFSDYGEDYSSKWEYQPETTENYSTMASTALTDIEVNLDELDAGEAPRGDKSMIIKTDYGELKSKYHYLGFGLWENTEPSEPPPPPKKPSPPPPPPKAEPIWYNCTVSVESHKTSKELDDLVQGLEGYERMPERKVEVGMEGGNLPGCLGDIHEPFEKEDMSEMFRRAFLEKMSGFDETDRRLYKCCVCSETIHGRIITAKAQKFHPQCFLCTYCRKEFKDRTFKSDNEGKPYCFACFEKLLGHFGTAHMTSLP